VKGARMPDAFCETHVVARELGLTPDRVRRMEAAGIIHAVRTVGGRRLFARAEIERVRALRDAQRDSGLPRKTA